MVVHPRLRGELVVTLSQKLLPFRFIPAYAGNSSAREQKRTEDAVHPRLRGELT